MFSGEGHEPFQWHFIHGSQYGVLKQWCAKNVADRKQAAAIAVQKLVERGVLSEQVAKDRVRQLIGQ